MSTKPAGNPEGPATPAPASSNPAAKPAASAQAPVSAPAPAAGFATLIAGFGLVILLAVGLIFFLGANLKSIRAADQVADFFAKDPFIAVSFAASIIAIMTIPLAFAYLVNQKYFEPRRGRVQLRPAFASVVMGMALTMAVPAIFAALVVKSRYFDSDRYAFDPNKVVSVLDQGRGFRSLQEADEAVRVEMERLRGERNRLVDSVKDLDKELLKLRSLAMQSQPVAKALNPVLEKTAVVRKAVGLDAPQQLIDLKALPVDLPGAPVLAMAPAPAAVSPAPAAKTSAGLTAAEVTTELAAVPDPQKPLAKMLPLDNAPDGWVVGKMGERRLETFNDQNLYEKIDGRAESFVQFGVKGMAYTFFHLEGDESSEIQLYVFELGDSVNAFGKFSTEKPENITPIQVGDGGYSAAGSTLFYSGKYYTQIVATDPKLTPVTVEIAKRVAERQRPAQPTGTAMATASNSNSTPAVGSAIPATPQGILSLLPAQPAKSGETYLATDAFGFETLTGVFCANYKAGDGVDWDAFLRPFKTPDEAKAAFKNLHDEQKRLDAKLTILPPENGVEIMVAEAFGLFDVVYVKNNVMGGVNGSEKREPAEQFVRDWLKTLPANVPALATEEPQPAAQPKGEGEGEKQ